MNTPLINVAIAEDHTIVRKGLIELIASFPEFKVVAEAANGREFIDKIGRAPVLPDVVIIDIGMPVMNGYETAAYIREHWPDTKMLALSMLQEEFTIIKMLRNGAHGFITKDCDPIDLRNALNGVFNSTYYYSDLVTSRLLHGLHVDDAKANNISEKEMEFLKHCCSDLSYKEIGDRMCLSPRTVEGYRDALFKKLNLRTRVGLVIFALRTGISTFK